MAGSVRIENLRVTRGDFTLTVGGLSINPREIFAILGETGSGKTVLMEAIAGAFPFDEGHIFLNGMDVDEVAVQHRSLGVVYQDYALFPHMTVRENISYGLRMHGVSSDEIKHRVDCQLELFSIAHIAARYPGIISGGESQRTALARALVLEPEILLLDEPFSALDPTTKQRMYAVLRDIHQRFDCTIVLVTHDFNEAVQLADRVGVVLNGRLRMVAEANRLFDMGHDKDVRRFLGR